jgi:hypothetical protein
MCLINSLHEQANRLFFEEFVKSKFGYGTWDAPYWFVGPEEAGGADCAELADRLAAWEGLASDDEDYRGLLNLREYAGAINTNAMDFFGFEAGEQNTWINLLRLLGQPWEHICPPVWLPIDPAWEREDLAEWPLLYQREFLAQPDVMLPGDEVSRVALLEISPLPSPDTKLWLWRCIAAEPVEQLQHLQLQSRTTFLLAEDGDGLTLLRRRMDMIRGQIITFKPRLVIFYGCKTGEGALLQAVAEEINHQFRLAAPIGQHIVPHSQIEHAETRVTHLFWIYHPSYWGRNPNVNRMTIQAGMNAAGVTPWADA